MTLGGLWAGAVTKSVERSDMRALVLGFIVVLGLSGCGSKGTSCRSNGPESCTCVAESHFSDDNTCTPAASAPSICCGQPEWPKTGMCTCRSFYCVNDSRDDAGIPTACHCNSVYPDGGVGISTCTLTAPDGGAVHCCLATTALGTKFACACGEAECADGTTEVTNCTADKLTISAYCDLLAPGDGGMPGATTVQTCR
jgi:hypothetical protein